MDFEDLDKFIDVMPLDVEIEYREFKQKHLEQIQKEIEINKMFNSLSTELLILNTNEEKIKVKAIINDDLFAIECRTEEISEGNILVRTLSNGKQEFYKIMSHKLIPSNGIVPKHFQCQVQKVDAMEFNTKFFDNQRTHKLFISHSSKDKKYMTAMVTMLESIGIPENAIVCTSVPGCGIPGGEKIFDWLREQFLSCELRVIFAFSKEYFDSTACLNEMGAAWITKATYSLLLLPGFDYNEIKGCVDNSSIGIRFDSDEDELKYRLNELKDTLIEEFSLSDLSDSRWERYRDQLIENIKNLANNS